MASSLFLFDFFKNFCYNIYRKQKEGAFYDSV